MLLPYMDRVVWTLDTDRQGRYACFASVTVTVCCCCLSTRRQPTSDYEQHDNDIIMIKARGFEMGLYGNNVHRNHSQYALTNSIL